MIAVKDNNTKSRRTLKFVSISVVVVVITPSLPRDIEEQHEWQFRFMPST